MIILMACAYSFVAGMVANRVWLRIRNLNLSSRKKAFIVSVWSVGWIVSFPLLGIMEENRG